MTSWRLPHPPLFRSEHRHRLAGCSCRATSGPQDAWRERPCRRGRERLTDPLDVEPWRMGFRRPHRHESAGPQRVLVPVMDVDGHGFLLTLGQPAAPADGHGSLDRATHSPGAAEPPGVRPTSRALFFSPLAAFKCPVDRPRLLLLTTTRGRFVLPGSQGAGRRHRQGRTGAIPNPTRVGRPSKTRGPNPPRKGPFRRLMPRRSCALCRHWSRRKTSRAR